MNTTPNLTDTQYSRQALLYLWLRENRISLASLARRIGVSQVSVGKWVQAESIPIKRLEQLKEIGIPEALLPEGVDIPTGPKPGWKRLSNVKAMTDSRG